MLEDSSAIIEHVIEDIDALQQHGVNAGDINKIKGFFYLFLGQIKNLLWGHITLPEIIFL
jgi:hypothetical protein